MKLCTCLSIVTTGLRHVWYTTMSSEERLKIRLDPHVAVGGKAFPMHLLPSLLLSWKLENSALESRWFCVLFSSCVLVTPLSQNTFNTVQPWGSIKTWRTHLRFVSVTGCLWDSQRNSGGEPFSALFHGHFHVCSWVLVTAQEVATALCIPRSEMNVLLLAYFVLWL